MELVYAEDQIEQLQEQQESAEEKTEQLQEKRNPQRRKQNDYKEKFTENSSLLGVSVQFVIICVHIQESLGILSLHRYVIPIWNG